MADAVAVAPHDRWRCHGCGQLLAFDARCYVAQDQLDACRSRCDWELAERDGRPAAGDGGR